MMTEPALLLSDDEPTIQNNNNNNNNKVFDDSSEDEESMNNDNEHQVKQDMDDNDGLSLTDTSDGITKDFSAGELQSLKETMNQFDEHLNSLKQQQTSSVNDDSKIIIMDNNNKSNNNTAEKEGVNIQKHDTYISAPSISSSSMPQYDHFDNYQHHQDVNNNNNNNNHRLSAITLDSELLENISEYSSSHLGGGENNSVTSSSTPPPPHPQQQPPLIQSNSTTNNNNNSFLDQHYYVPIVPSSSISKTVDISPPKNVDQRPVSPSSLSLNSNNTSSSNISSIYRRTTSKSNNKLDEIDESKPLLVDLNAENLNKFVSELETDHDHYFETHSNSKLVTEVCVDEQTGERSEKFFSVPTKYQRSLHSSTHIPTSNNIERNDSFESHNSKSSVFSWISSVLDRNMSSKQHVFSASTIRESIDSSEDTEKVTNIIQSSEDGSDDEIMDHEKRLHYNSVGSKLLSPTKGLKSNEVSPDDKILLYHEIPDANVDEVGLHSLQDEKEALLHEYGFSGSPKSDDNYMHEYSSEEDLHGTQSNTTPRLNEHLCEQQHNYSHHFANYDMFNTKAPAEIGPGYADCPINESSNSTREEPIVHDNKHVKWSGEAQEARRVAASFHGSSPNKYNNNTSSSSWRGNNSQGSNDEFPTYICPRCHTRQRQFFDVNSMAGNNNNPFIYAFVYLMFYCVIAVFVFGSEESWSPIDCIYFSVVTLTTTGLGDYTPTTETSKLMCTIFIYAGVASIGLLLGSLIAYGMEDDSKRAAKEQYLENCQNCKKLQASNFNQGYSGVSWNGQKTHNDFNPNFESHLSPKVQQWFSEHGDGMEHQPNNVNTRSVYSNHATIREDEELSAVNTANSSTSLQTELKISGQYGSMSSNVYNKLPDIERGEIGSPPKVSMFASRHVKGSHTRHQSLALAPSASNFNNTRGRTSTMEHDHSSTFYDKIFQQGLEERSSNKHSMKRSGGGSSSEYYSSDSDGSYFTSSSTLSSSLDPFKISEKSHYAYIFTTMRQAIGNSFLVIGLGAIIISYIEEYTFLDAFYFSTVLLTSVGYGDIVPVTDAGKVFVTMYVLVGGTVLLSNMSRISMVPLELRKRRIEQKVLVQFGDALDDEALRELATGSLVKRMQIGNTEGPGGLPVCTREMFALAMLVRLGRITEKDVLSTFVAFRRLDAGEDGKLDSRDIIFGEMQRRTGKNLGAMKREWRKSRTNLVQMGEEHEEAASKKVPLTVSNPDDEQHNNNLRYHHHHGSLDRRNQRDYCSSDSGSPGLSSDDENGSEYTTTSSGEEDNYHQYYAHQDLKRWNQEELFNAPSSPYTQQSNSNPNFAAASNVNADPSSCLFPSTPPVSPTGGEKKTVHLLSGHRTSTRSI